MGMMNKNFTRRVFSVSLLVLIPILAALSQQPQTQTAPIYSVNAKYVNGVAPGYWTTPHENPSSSLIVNLSSGTVFCLGTIRTFTHNGAGDLTLTNNTTNYVYLDTTASCAPAFNTSGFTLSTIPIAKVVTSGGVITTVTDDRTTMSTSVGSGAVTGGTCTNQAVTAISTLGVPTCTTLTSAYVNNSIALTGTDINTSNQVIATHLSSALPINQGGTGTTSTLTGLVRGSGSAMTAAELSGDVTTSGSNATTIAANAVTAAKSAVVLTRRVCAMPVGADNASAVLVDADLGPQSRQCVVPYEAHVVEIDVSSKPSSTPNVIPGRNRAGTIVNLVSSALATAAGGALACSNTGGTTGIDGVTTCSATLQNTALNAGDYIELVSGTAGGTAKAMSIQVIYTVD